jgi:hypothetical protein
MRNGLLLAAVLFVSGCEHAPSMPSKPAEPALPSKPAEPVMMAPKKPADAKAVDAPRQPELPKPEAPKPEQAIDKTPIKADVSKVKFLSEPAELFGYDDGESRAFFYTNGTGELVVKVPADGEYEITVTASCTAAKGENAKFKLKVDGAVVGAETQLKSEDAKDYPFATALKAGDRKIATEFTNDLYKEGEYDLNFYLNGLKLVRTK